jgi:hypothetical protein
VSVATLEEMKKAEGARDIERGARELTLKPMMYLLAEASFLSMRMV